jgi:hypothetical protein
MKPLTTGFRIQFDLANEISLIRVEGRLADESLAELYEATQDYSNATNARVSIVDLTSVSEFALSTTFIANLAHQKPLMANTKRRCFIVAREGHAFGLCRMFQLLGETIRPLLQIVHTRGEAFAAIGIQSPHFEPSAVPAPFRTGYPAAVVA